MNGFIRWFCNHFARYHTLQTKIPFIKSAREKTKCVNQMILFNLITKKPPKSHNNEKEKEYIQPRKRKKKPCAEPISVSTLACISRRAEASSSISFNLLFMSSRSCKFLKIRVFSQNRKKP